MDTATKIINYLRHISDGKINLSLKAATGLLEEIAKADSKDPFVKLHAFNDQHRRWDVMYTIKTTQEKIDFEIKEHLQRRPIDNLYMFECYNAAGEPEGKIFTARVGLFDNQK